MGTRTKIRIEHKGKYLCSKYYNMDGHIENWADKFVNALQKTTPDDILKNRRLLRFMYDDYVDDDCLSYLCIVDLADVDYKITVYGYDKELLFQGNLDEFARKYIDEEDDEDEMD